MGVSRKHLQTLIGVSSAFILLFLMATLSWNPTIRVDLVDIDAASAAAAGDGNPTSVGKPAEETHVRKVLQVASSSGGGILPVIKSTPVEGKDFLVNELYTPGFLISNSDLCQPRHNISTKLLILVTTAPGNQAKRKAVRETWGHFSVMNEVRMSFLLGRTSDDRQQLVREEDRVYGDIIQGNFVDHYDNLTLKTTAMLEWIETYCPQVPFVLKTDDDMYVNVPLLLKFVDNHRADSNTIYGRLAHKWKPVRNKDSKYFVAKSTFSQTYYPDFCTGPAYLLTTDVVPKLYNETLHTKYMKLEDVLVTGIAAQKQKVRLVNVPEIKNTSPEKPAPTACMLEKTMTYHDIPPEKLYQYWSLVRSKSKNCDS